LAIVAFVVVGIAVQLTSEPSNPEQTVSKNKLFPNLMDKLNDVDNIKISNSSENFTVQLKNGTWGLVDKNNYPVKEENVRNVLLGIASLNIVEAKTQKPENYATLGVQDVNIKNADSALVALNQGETTIASIIVGYDRIARSDNTLHEIYVRKPGEEQSWAVEGLLQLEKQASDWLEKSIINVESSRIRDVVISENGAEIIHIFKEKPSQSDYQMANLPEKAMISSSYSVNQIANFLANLTMEDVSISDSLGTNVGRNIVFSTYDGLQVTLNIVKQNDVYYAKFAAAYVEPNAIEIAEAEEVPTLKSSVEVQKEVAELNQKLAAWVYELQRFKANYLFKQASELYKIAEESVESEEEMDDEPPVFSLEDALSNLSTNGNASMKLPPLGDMLGN
jgi:hypothetical protein